MTYGIDISTHQVLLDVDFAVAAGTEFAGAKSVASYLPNLTVADDYHSNIDDIIEAGLDHAKFHYAVPNSLNTPKVTAQFQWQIRYRYRPTDAFLLDNEPLDKYAVYWRDDDAAEYFEELHSLGARYDQMWFYCPAHLTRSSGPWPKMLALRAKGLKIMWVSYGDMDAILEPGEEPNVGTTGFADPELHQFTSAWTVPGYAGRIDRIYSRLTVAELFAAAPPPAREPNEKEYNMLSIIHANDSTATPSLRWAVHGPGYWRVIVSEKAAIAAAARHGDSGPVYWAEWDAAFDAAVSSGFVPKAGQTSRTAPIIPTA